MGYTEGCLFIKVGLLSGSRLAGEPPRRQRTLALHGPDYQQGPLPLPLLKSWSHSLARSLFGCIESTQALRAPDGGWGRGL